MLDLATKLEEERRSELKRLVLLSALAHAALFVALTFSPSFESRSALPGVVSVDLIAAVPSGSPPPRAAPKPAPKPAPVKPKPVAKPVPKPIPPKPKTVVLPKEATKAPEKVAQKAEPKVAPVEEPAAEAPQQDYEDVMRELREEAGEEAPQPVETASAAPGPLAAGGGGGGDARVSPEVAAWLKQAEIHVRKVWVLAPGFRSEPLEAHLMVELDEAGNVLGTPVVKQRSGNPWYDDSVVRAVQKASPLPAPPEAGEWLFVFRPQEG